MRSLPSFSALDFLTFFPLILLRQHLTTKQTTLRNTHQHKAATNENNKKNPTTTTTTIKMSSPIVPKRAPTLKIALGESSFSFDRSSSAVSPSSATKPSPAAWSIEQPRRKSSSGSSYAGSYQGTRCHCCGTMFVISNKCINRQCSHVSCEQCV
ncbi:hypothetical protein M0657_007655 [Pyricularia oryzae]|nr:hypothetical protein M0657_007655 [Pyricularia oryzae]